MWLETYMFKQASDRKEKAARVSERLADHKHFKSHARHIPRPEIEELRLAVVRLEGDETLQDLALSVFHATTHTFTGTPAVKIVESHTGRAFIKHQIVQPAPTVQLGMLAPDQDDPGAKQGL